MPFYLEYGFADLGATAANCVVKEWTDKGGKVFAHRAPCRSSTSSCRAGSREERERIHDALLGSRNRTRAGGRFRRRLQGVRRPDAEIEEETIGWLGL